jgi:hypothetical protein
MAFISSVYELQMIHMMFMLYQIRNESCPRILIYTSYIYCLGARSSVVSGAIMIQAGSMRVRFSMRSVDF